jgi:hypothetical protein
LKITKTTKNELKSFLAKDGIRNIEDTEVDSILSAMNDEKELSESAGRSNPWCIACTSANRLVHKNWRCPRDFGGVCPHGY